MKLNDLEKSIQQGGHGEARRWALEQQIAVGEFFDAGDFVEVSQVHLCADTEALGSAGVEFVEKIAAAPDGQGKIWVPSITDPRGADFKRHEAINQDKDIVALERRLANALHEMGFLLTDTCINYQCILPPVRGEHLAFGDTGSVIFANSVASARSNYEGGPAALAAALTGRVPRYGYHLDEVRKGTHLFALEQSPACYSDWGAIGGLIGRRMGSYWDVPVIVSNLGRPNADELKHMGAAMASFGSTAMFQFVGITPEAPTLESAFSGAPPQVHPIGPADIAAFYGDYRPGSDDLDVVVFAAPQLSLFEMKNLSSLLSGRKVHPNTAMLVATAPAIKAMCDRDGITASLEEAGAIVLEGVCFYQMHARELGQANGWRTLMTNSAKLVNIIGGYGYDPALAPMTACVDSAVAGRILPGRILQ